MKAEAELLDSQQELFIAWHWVLLSISVQLHLLTQKVSYKKLQVFFFLFFPYSHGCYFRLFELKPERPQYYWEEINLAQPRKEIVCPVFLLHGWSVQYRKGRDYMRERSMSMEWDFLTSWQSWSVQLCKSMRLYVMIWGSKMVQSIWGQKSKGVTHTCCPSVWIKVAIHESLIRNVFNSRI